MKMKVEGISGVESRKLGILLENNKIRRTDLVEMSIRAEDGQSLVVANSTSTRHVEKGMILLGDKKRGEKFK